MKTVTILLITICSIISFSQTEHESHIIINDTQQDDTYRAGETIKLIHSKNRLVNN